MFKTKLLAAALALGLSGMASAAITGGSTGNTEFVFSAFADGKGYTFDLADAGFNSAYGTDVKMNSLLTSTVQTSTAIGTTLKHTLGNKIVFDLALPDFSSFMSGVTASNVKWNLVSAETSGIFRIIQTVSTAPVSTLTNSAIISAANKFDQYTSAVSTKGANPASILADDAVHTVVADGTAYAGNLGSSLGGSSYSSTGSLNDVLGLYVLSSTTTTSSTTQGRFAKLMTAAGSEAKAQVVLNANDNLYHLVVAVPEPETYAMLLAGLGMLGFVARRNRRA